MWSPKGEKKNHSSLTSSSRAHKETESTHQTEKDHQLWINKEKKAQIHSFWPAGMKCEGGLAEERQQEKKPCV